MGSTGRGRVSVRGSGLGFGNPLGQQDDTQQTSTDNSQQGNNSGSDADAQQRFVTMDDQQTADWMNSIIPGGPNAPDLTGLNKWNDLQTLTASLGMHEKPVVLSDSDFDQAMQTEALDGVTLYRGVTGNRNMSGEQVADQIKFGDKTYIGDGIHGDGIYFTTRYGYAHSYAGGNSKAIVQSFIDKNRAVVITEDRARSMHTQARRNGDPIALSMSFDQYALKQGYNVIHVPGGNNGTSYSYRDPNTGKIRRGGEDFYVPLTRSVLVIREHVKRLGTR